MMKLNADGLGQQLALEVVAGLHEGDLIVTNPGDVVRDGLKVDVGHVRVLPL